MIRMTTSQGESDNGLQGSQVGRDVGTRDNLFKPASFAEMRQIMFNMSMAYERERRSLTRMSL